MTERATLNVLALTRYGRLGASSRVRFIQYLPELSASGIRVEVSPLFSDDYVRGLQQGKKSFQEIVCAYARRARVLLGADDHDLLWIEKECLPWLPMGFERALSRAIIPYVLDYDDAVFHHYDSHSGRLVRYVLGRKHPALMRGAEIVVAGNPYLAQFAGDVGARRVQVIPTAVDLKKYDRVQDGDRSLSSAAPCIGWIGQRATAEFLRPLASLFARLIAEGKARCAAIGIDAQALKLPMASLPWTEDSEVAAIAGFDIGIMPLLDGPFERGKCGYKLIQYMACGLPVVASPVGVNSEIVEHGVNGFLARTPEEWSTALETLLGDPSLRRRMGQAGRAKVEREYCIQVTGPRLAELLRSAASRGFSGV